MLELGVWPRPNGKTYTVVYKRAIISLILDKKVIVCSGHPSLRPIPKSHSVSFLSIDVLSPLQVNKSPILPESISQRSTPPKHTQNLTMSEAPGKLSFSERTTVGRATPKPEEHKRILMKIMTKSEGTNVLKGSLFLRDKVADSLLCLSCSATPNLQTFAIFFTGSKFSGGPPNI